MVKCCCLFFSSQTTAEMLALQAEDTVDQFILRTDGQAFLQGDTDMIDDAGRDMYAGTAYDFCG